MLSLIHISIENPPEQWKIFRNTHEAIVDEDTFQRVQEPVSYTHLDVYKRQSLLLLEQIRTVDRRRLRGYIGQISKKKMKEIDAALAISVGLRSLA